MADLVQISETQSNKTVTANENFHATGPAALFGAKLSECVGLTWSYYGGYMLVSGVLTAIDGDNLTLTDDIANYIEADTDGIVYSTVGSPPGFTSGRIPLYIVTVAGSLVTDYTDVRSFALQALP